MTHARPIPNSFDSLAPSWEMGAPERIGPPLVNRRRRRAVRTIAVLAIAGGGGWLWFDGRLNWVAPLVDDAVKLVASSERTPPSPQDASSVAPMPQLALLDPRALTEPVPTAAAGPAIAAPEPPTAREKSVERAEPPAADPTAPSPPVPYTPPPPATDPLARRAEAVGLHPGLSRAILERLSADDFRNAGAAITKAIAETPDDGALEWPRTKSGKLALFRVHFVAGAGESCRRYVVAIAKDGWLTTALPMERCGTRKGAG